MLVLDTNFPELGENIIPFDHSVFLDFKNGNRYYLDTLSDRIIYFDNFDSENNTASGTFYFKAINENNQLDTLVITDGRFNVDWLF